MLIIAVCQYYPGTAACNRIMAYVKALSDMGIRSRVVFFMPDKRRSKVEEVYREIDFEYLWDKFYLDVPCVKSLFLRNSIWRFVKGLNKGDRVYVYGFPELVVALSERSDISVFVERTEHDEVSFVTMLKEVNVELFHDACRKISGVIVISQALKDYYVGLGCRPECVHIVNMIVDTTRFESVMKHQSEEYVAYCGTAMNSKDGVDLLIRSFVQVVYKHPEYKLYIIGSTLSKKQKYDNIELVKELGIESNVVFTGVVGPERIPQLLKNAKVLALCRPDNKQAKYGFPTKLGEYLLTGNPVVVTSVGDIPLFLKDGESALISKPGDIQEFSDKLCWAIENPLEAGVIGKNGLKVALRNFNYLEETRKLVAILND